MPLLALFTRRPKEAPVPETAPAQTPSTSLILMRFLTQGGATVQVTKSEFCFPFECQGCGYKFDNYTSLTTARYEANGHAEACRALPRSDGA